MQLTVYVSPGCLGCDQTFELVHILRESFQSLDVVEVIDTSQMTSGELPPDLFAVPSWYADGRLFSLGNPPIERLRALIVRSSSQD